jgi:ElaB/YqjD/DUF883 family membrane-anchored ribosome-binding protein
MSQDEMTAAPDATTETTSTGERLRQQREQLSRRKEEVRRNLERVREDAQKLAKSTKATAADLASMLREHVTERPLLVLGGAFTVGWLCGWLVPGWLVRFGFGVAKQAAPLALTQQAVARTLV